MRPRIGMADDCILCLADEIVDWGCYAIRHLDTGEVSFVSAIVIVRIVRSDRSAQFCPSTKSRGP